MVGMVGGAGLISPPLPRPLYRTRAFIVPPSARVLDPAAGSLISFIEDCRQDRSLRSLRRVQPSQVLERERGELKLASAGGTPTVGRDAGL